jgi:hypothetical protein
MRRRIWRRVEAAQKSLHSRPVSLRHHSLSERKRLQKLRKGFHPCLRYQRPELARFVISTVSVSRVDTNWFMPKVEIEIEAQRTSLANHSVKAWVGNSKHLRCMSHSPARLTVNNVITVIGSTMRRAARGFVAVALHAADSSRTERNFEGGSIELR